MGFDGLLILNTAGSLVANNGAENHCKHLFQGGGGGEAKENHTVCSLTCYMRFNVVKPG